MKSNRFAAVALVSVGVLGGISARGLTRAQAQEVTVEEQPGEVDVQTQEAPPAPQIETIVIERRPSPKHIWIHGHWAWHGRWQWVPGHWHLIHEGHHWVGGHWEAREGRYHWIAGSWIEEAKVLEERPGLLIATAAPPAPIMEKVYIELRPSPRHVWIPGHWAWHGHWFWEHGHWHLAKEGHHWTHGHWYEKGGQWHWQAGSWVEEIKVTEEAPGLVVATQVPPAPLQETILIETRPSPNHIWIHGHWAWHGHWVWEHGHWHVNQVGKLWVHGHWYAKDGQWRWEEGHWVEEVKVTEERPGELIATSAPPALIEEKVIIELRPSPRHVWIAGHWAWHGHWQWEHGHWHLAPGEGHTWVAGRWESRDGRYHWVGGAWRH